MVEAEWEEVKPKKKKAKPQQQAVVGKNGVGGMNAKGMLIPGAVRKYGGPAASASANTYDQGADFNENKMMPINQASAIADYDFGVEEGDNSNINVEMVSHTCAMSIKNARLQADLTQAQLAKKINEKTSLINELENASCKYSAELINRIEKALNAKIDRGRKRRKNR